MKKLWTVMIGALALGVLVLLVSCSKDSTSTSAGETDQSALTSMMQDDSDLEAVDAWGGDDLGGSSPLDSAVTPLNWARAGVRRYVSFNVSFQGDTATITRTASYNGTFRVLIDTTGGVRTVITKTMHNSLVRKAHARRIAHGRLPRDNWRIYEVTPEVMLSSDTNTVQPARVQFIYTAGGAPVQALNITDPLNTYFSRDSLPAIPVGAQLTVVVTPTETDTVAAFLHPHAWREGRLHRVAMTPGAENTYSATFTVGPRIGVHVTAPDLISSATLYTSDGVYDAGSWAIPYRTVQ